MLPLAIGGAEAWSDGPPYFADGARDRRRPRVLDDRDAARAAVHLRAARRRAHVVAPRDCRDAREGRVVRRPEQMATRSRSQSFRAAVSEDLAGRAQHGRRFASRRCRDIVHAYGGFSSATDTADSTADRIPARLPHHRLSCARTCGSPLRRGRRPCRTRRRRRTAGSCCAMCSSVSLTVTPPAMRRAQDALDALRGRRRTSTARADAAARRRRRSPRRACRTATSGSSGPKISSRITRHRVVDAGQQRRREHARARRVGAIGRARAPRAGRDGAVAQRRAAARNGDR